MTSCFYVETDEAEQPILGRDPELTCDCPRMVELAWIPLPSVAAASGRMPIAPLIVVW